jgi:hypothetical protein
LEQQLAQHPAKQNHDLCPPPAITTLQAFSPGALLFLTGSDTDRIISDGHAQRRAGNPDTQRTQHTTGSRMSITSIDTTPLALAPTRNTSNSSRFGALAEIQMQHSLQESQAHQSASTSQQSNLSHSYL